MDTNPTIDIAMTASLRPDIVEQTLYHLRKNIQFSGQLRLVVDISSVGDTRYIQADVLKSILWFFPDAMVRTIPNSIQAEALAWTWFNCSANYILQWEDDWELQEPVDLDVLISQFPSDAGVICLDRVEKPALTYPGYKGQYQSVAPTLAVRVRGKSLGGPPALLRYAYTRDVLKILDGHTCLDLLSRTDNAQLILCKWGVYCYLGEHGKGSLVKDIGKKWRADRNIIMKKDTERGVTWIQK